jgi:hypothetical protein
MGTSSKKFRSLFHKVSISVNTLFPPLRETLYAGRVKLFAEASELFTHVLFQIVVARKTASSHYIIQGAKRWKSESAKSGQ